MSGLESVPLEGVMGMAGLVDVKAGGIRVNASESKRR